MALKIKNTLGKKAFIFTMDAFLAAAVLITGLILMSQYTVKEKNKESLQYASTDLLNALSEIHMSDLPSSVFDYYNSSSVYTDFNKTIVEQLGTYWSVNETSLAANLTEYLLNDLLPQNVGFQITLDQDSLYNKNTSYQSDIYTADRMITGVLPGAPLSGSTSSAYLRRIKDKRSSSFAYFGGFVGQGNISVVIDLPSDVTSADITRMLIEADAAGNFTLNINGILCKTLNISTANMTPDYWVITGCNSSIVSGKNNISLQFSDSNTAYVAGGYVRIDYKTDDLQTSLSLTNKTYYFPEIKGVVNLYDSFYVPGNISNMKIYLHYLADHSVSAFNNTFYLNIGNSTVYIDTDSISEQSITLNNATLGLILNYSNMNSKTVPIRMGFENLTYDAQLIGNSEVVLITDESGSMEWKMIGADWDDGDRRNCDSASLNSSDTTRLSVAKCLAKEFVSQVLNITGNSLGLVSFSDSLQSADTVSPTTNTTRLLDVIGNASPETGYSAGGGTCICCGINGARNQLILGASRTTLIASGSSWKYTVNNFSGAPANDSEGDFWSELDFNDASWSSGNAILGYNYSGSGTITTNLGFSNSTLTYANLWERTGDVAGPPNDFTSGTLNSTANTFGISGANDGWDWAGGSSAFGSDNDVDFNGITSGELNFDFRTGSPAQNRCASNDCSGAYGITVNITSQMHSYINNNGTAILTFDYEWNGNDDPFETSDQVWIKAIWVHPNSSQYWLGSDLDASDTGSDNELEIATVDNPDQEFSGSAIVDLTSLINQSGNYYLMIGGSIRANSNDEWGTIYLDNIKLTVVNQTSKYYFRKNFTISDMNLVKKAHINLMSDDYANVYVNGNLVHSGQSFENGTHWDVRGINVDTSYLTAGSNNIAVELTNLGENALFDLEMIGINKSGQTAMLSMTDGQANQACAEQGTTADLDGDGSANTASDDAIQAACDAREDWGIQVFAVGFSSSADEPTLQGIAGCGEGLYAKSDNLSGLSNFYNQVVLNIISATVRSQTIILSGGSSAASNLYGDSYIQYDVNPNVAEPSVNEIGVETQTSQFNSCSPIITIPLGIRVIDAKITSYSGEHWTKTLNLNGINVFNLTEYNSNYITLGDPFVLQAPPNIITTGNNTLFIDTGDEPYNSTSCSPNNTLVYTALVPSSTSRSGVVEKTDGCTWSIQFEDDTISTKNIPSSHSGINQCSYTASNHTLSQGSYDDKDAYDIAVYNVLSALDFDNNGKVFVNLDEEDIEIVITTISSVPYLWGPSLLVAKAWQ